MRPFELFISLRYLRTKRRNGFLSLITVISALGIALGVAALITVISVMNGFQGELRDRILGVTSHVVVSGYRHLNGSWEQVIDTATEVPDVKGGAPYVREQGMLTKGGSVSGVLVRGVLPEWERKVSDLAANMVAGRLKDLEAGEYGVVVGKTLAHNLALEKGDPITLVAPTGQVTPAGMLPRLKRFTVVGIFDAGMYEYNSGMIYAHMADVQKLYRMNGNVSGVRLRLAEPMEAPRVAAKLRERLGGAYFVRDWTQRNRNFFQALHTEKVVMFVILSLIVMVAAFNIVSSLVMLVNEKRGDIAILRTLGASPGNVTAIFMVQGTVIGLFGVLLGGIGGVALALNVEGLVAGLESLFQTQFLPSNVYSVSRLPSELHWADVAWITVAGLLMSFLATIYPSRRAAKTDPVEALRYE
ncbi:lipoprotein-releasing ABC transporter permease subunit [Thiohalorhabdus methylotrophus]|uniref:Lipoprotein-releasing ABC transporter permease subunit n=1 Tax=Thiohalorhabdus methylotrophus TaxID=3242694 RepID=A0ABV4TW50_9GAMM